MATRWGHAVYDWLLLRGWLGTPLQSGVCGDRQVKDPATQEEMDVYHAARLHATRTGDYPDFLNRENI